MTDCSRWEAALYAEEPVMGLDIHLSVCPSCRMLDGRLKLVDRQEREAPIPEPTPGLVDAILRRLEETHLLERHLVCPISDPDGYALFGPIGADGQRKLVVWYGAGDLARALQAAAIHHAVVTIPGHEVR